MRHVKTMLAVDSRRMFRSKLFWIMAGICFVMPVLILVMTTMMDGSVSVDPKTGVQTVAQGFDNMWQIIGSPSGSGMSMDMGMTSMCNLNMLYFLIAVLVGVFVSQDFRSGFSKNLFTVRAKKESYVISKTLVCSLGGMAMLVRFVVGSFLGGAIAGLPFEMIGFSAGNLVLCILSKPLLAPIFVAISLCFSVIAKDKTWLSILLSMMVGMLLFMMIPMMTPLDAGLMNVILCLAGSVLFSLVLGLASNFVLSKTALV